MKGAGVRVDTGSNGGIGAAPEAGMRGVFKAGARVTAGAGEDKEEGVEVGEEVGVASEEEVGGVSGAGTGPACFTVADPAPLPSCRRGQRWFRKDTLWVKAAPQVRQRKGRSPV